MDVCVLDWNYETWVERLGEQGQPRFRAEQICKWIYRKRVFSFAEMTDLSLELREKLQALWSCGIPEVAAEQVSRRDGTRKLLWRLGDGQTVESVLLDQEGRRTACLSTQVGCALGCAFCATGQTGFVRNLTAGEIVGQFLGMEARYGELQNLVTMGMGEPLLNPEVVFRALEILKHPKMRGLGSRHMTLSTCGVVPGIRRLAASGLGVRLALSLHAAQDELRDRLVPLNAQYPLQELRKALEEYQQVTRDRISIEYALFEGVNDDPSQARQLGEFLRGLSVFVNLIPGNRSLADDYRRPPRYRVEQFQAILERQGYEVAVRAEKGSDIDAACGQLRQRVEGPEGQRPREVLPPEPERLPRPSGKVAETSGGDSRPRGPRREEGSGNRRPREDRFDAPRPRSDQGPRQEGPRGPRREEGFRPGPRPQGGSGEGRPRREEGSGNRRPREDRFDAPRPRSDQGPRQEGIPSHFRSSEGDRKFRRGAGGPEGSGPAGSRPQGARPQGPKGPGRPGGKDVRSSGERRKPGASGKPSNKR